MSFTLNILEVVRDINLKDMILYSGTQLIQSVPVMWSMGQGEMPAPGHMCEQDRRDMGWISGGRILRDNCVALTLTSQSLPLAEFVNMFTF